MENMTDFEAALKILAGAENNQARNFKWSHHHSSNSAASWESRMSCKLRRTLYTIYEDDFETLAELGFDRFVRRATPARSKEKLRTILGWQTSGYSAPTGAHHERAHASTPRRV